MRIGRLFAGLMLAGAVLVASPQAGVAFPGPGHYAVGTGTLPNGSTLEISAAHLTDAHVGGSGSAILTTGAGQFRIALACLVIGFSGAGHFLGAAGIGSHSSGCCTIYYITITDSGPNTSVPDTAGISTAPGAGPCQGPAAADVLSSSYAIVL